MRPARWAVDLFRPARVQPTTVTTTVIRNGGRISIIDAELRQENGVVARSRALFTRPSRSPAGTVWKPHRSTSIPPTDIDPTEDQNRLYYSADRGWSPQADDHDNDSHKQIWHLPIVLVEGEDLTAFQMVAAVADVASLALNWGAAGLEFINADLDMMLTRLPITMEVGLSATDRSEIDGISVGTAALFDRAGPLGSVSVVALANSHRRVDPANRNPDLSAYTR